MLVLYAMMACRPSEGDDKVGDDTSCELVEACADADGDGWGGDDCDSFCEVPDGYTTELGDCDDTDRGIKPDRWFEACDGVDEDCDGEIDEAPVDGGTLFYRDDDDDGWGIPDDEVEACDQPEGYVELVGDCDDTNAHIHPDEDEVCGNGVDEDCDGADWCPIDPSDVYVAAPAERDQLGTALAAADLDGDGQHDLIVGADDHDAGGDAAGAAFLLAGPLTAARNASAAEATVLGASESDGLGGALAVVGDVDGDGLVDWAVGAPGSDAGGEGAGALYLLGGLATGLEGASTVLGMQTDWGVGGSAGWVGDLDGDGRDDLGVGATGAHYDSVQGGALFLFFEPPSGATNTWYADANLYAVEHNVHVGFAYAGVGDLDGDGLDDLAIGAPYDQNEGIYAGALFLVNGPVSGDVAVDRDGTTVAESDYDELGVAVASTGDLDGDGLADLVVGARGYDDGAGAVYVLLGPVTDGDLSAARAKAVGEAGSATGGDVAPGDYDGDGELDLLIAAQNDSYGGDSSGAAYVLYGPLSGSYELALGTDKVISGEAWTYTGRSVANAGDHDGDGVDEALVGATGATPSGQPEGGAAWLFSF